MHVPRLEALGEQIILELGLKSCTGVVLSSFSRVMMQALELDLVLLVEPEAAGKVAIANVANALFSEGKWMRLPVRRQRQQGGQPGAVLVPA